MSPLPLKGCGNSTFAAHDPSALPTPPAPGEMQEAHWELPLPTRRLPAAGVAVAGIAAAGVDTPGPPPRRP